ncbi:MAG TPA: SDR family oxidoreductase [Dongiaceae bacterium]|jgi:NAD(P)-dependent dehydrogenase (short-subunit alcohol dehydrogenase family)|nr:SDR family oxidoreductase [Dongiaceae bacterium]
MIGFSGKTAVITGAAGGIGRALVTLFAELGADIIACDRDGSGLKRFVEEGRDAGFRLHPVVADTTDEAAVKAGLERAIAEAGLPTILVNNAGYAVIETLGKTSVADWRHEVDVNLTGAFVMFKAVLPAMLKAGGGAVVNIGSVNGTSYLGHPAYSAAKAGLRSFTQAIATEYGNRNIRANLLCPGTVRTPIWNERMRRYPQVFERLRKWYPLGRVAEPMDIARVAAFLASDAATIVNGAVLMADGGLSAGNRVMAEELTLEQA